MTKKAIIILQRNVEIGKTGIGWVIIKGVEFNSSAPCLILLMHNLEYCSAGSSYIHEFGYKRFLLFGNRHIISCLHIDQ